MTENQTILDPSASVAGVGAGANLLVAGLSGKRVAFIDNSKPNFNVLAEDLADLLVKNYGVAGILKFRKRAPSSRATDAMLAQIQSDCDLVIAGSGD